MQKSLATFFLIFVVCFLHAQDDDKKGFQDTLGFKGFKDHKIPFQMNVIKTAPIAWFIGPALFNGEFRIDYERMLAFNQSLLLGASYNYPSPVILAMSSASSSSSSSGSTPLKDISINGVRGQLAYRFYPIKKLKAPMGLYVGPHLSYNYMDIRSKINKKDFLTYNSFFACAAVGFQIRIKKHVYMDFTSGIGYKKDFGSYNDQLKKQTSSSNSATSILDLPIKLLLQINIGYGF